jgi:hypothetical protein
MRKMHMSLFQIVVAKQEVNMRITHTVCIFSINKLYQETICIKRIRDGFNRRLKGPFK